MKRMLRVMGVLAVVLAVLVWMIPMATPALAGVGSPPGANSNDLAIALSVIPSLTYNGATVDYYMSMDNTENPNPLLITADAINIVVTFYPPGPDGMPVATPSYTSAPFNLAAGGAAVNLPVQHVTLALNPGVTNVIGRAHFSATLLTTPIDSQADGDKNIPLTISNPNTAVTITPSAGTVLHGGTVNLTVTESNSGNVPLTSPNVVLTNNPVLAPLPLTLTKASPSYVSGDNDGDGILDVAENWTWTVTGVAVNATTTFVAIGDGIDPLGTHITYPAYQGERMQVTVNVINPDTVVTINASASTVLSGGTVNLTVRERNNGDVQLTSPNVVLSNDPDTAQLPLTLIKTSPSYVSGDTDGDGILDAGEEWTWTVNGVVVNAPTTFTAIGDGIDTLGNHITYPAYQGERAQTTVSVSNPNTGVTINASAPTVLNGGTVNLTVTETNNGDVQLTSPNVVLSNNPDTAQLPLTLTKSSPSYVSGDTDGDGILDVGETWTWTVTGVVLNATTTFTVIGDGIDPLGHHITYPAYQGERAQTTVNVINPNTGVTIAASASTVERLGTVSLTVTESNNGDVQLTSPNVVVTSVPGTTTPLMPLTLTKASPSYVSGDNDGDGILDVGENWTWTVTGVVLNATTTFTATGDGIDTLGNHITYPAYQGERAQTTVIVSNPNSCVLITVSATQVLPGGTVNLTVTETNNGDVQLTSPNVVLSNNPVLAPLPLTLTKSSPSYVSGDTDGDGILDVGEGWTWTITGVVVNATTTFVAIADGIDPLGTHITYPVYPCERMQVTVNVISPNTGVTITASAPTVLHGGTVNLTVTESNSGNVQLTSPNVVLSNDPDTAQLPLTLTKSSPSYVSGDTDGDGILDVAENWTWTVTGVVVNAMTTFTAIGDGIDPLGTHITYPAYQGERAQTTVNVINPNTGVTITASPNTVAALLGGTVNLTVTESNSGDVQLTSPNVVLSNDPDTAQLPLTLTKSSPSYVSGDTDGDGILDAGETWTWTVTGVVVNATTTFTVIGDGIDPLGNHITYPGYSFERAQTTVNVINPETCVTIYVSAPQVLAGGTVNLTVMERNGGDVQLTSPNVVLSNDPDTAQLPLTLIKASPSYVSGDDDGDGILDVAENWTWTVTGVVVNGNTTFTAIGDALDPLGNHITYPWDYDERALITVTVISPNTGVTITASAPTVRPGGTVNLTVTESNSGDVQLTSPNVVVSNAPDTAQLPLTLTKSSPSYVSGDSDGDGILDVGETWTWTVTGVVVNATTNFTVIGDGIDPLGNHITYPAYSGERAQTTVTVINPNTGVTITASPNTVLSGRTVNLTVTENNNGDVQLTSPNVVLSNNPDTDQLPLTLTKASPSYISGDTDADGILDVGETWTWTVTGVVVNATTTFTVIGDGIDPLGNHITYPAFTGERMQVTVNAINPNTTTTITASEDTIVKGGQVVLTVTESNTGDVQLTSPSVVLSAPPSTTLTKTSPSYVSGDTDGDGILDVGETWTWSLSSGALNSTTIFAATGHGTDPLGNDITFPCYPNERAYVSVIVIEPSTYIEIASCTNAIYAGETISLTITDINNSDVPLTSPSVLVTNNPVLAPLPLTLTKSSPSYVSGDTNSNGIFDAGETWTWTVTGVVLNATTTFTAIGDGIDPLGNHITYPAYTGERAQVTVSVINPNTTVTITASAPKIVKGGHVTLTVTERNTGDVPLTNPNVVLGAPLSTTLTKTSPSYVSGDNDGDGILDVGENWTWSLSSGTLNSTTVIAATGHGTDSKGNDITFPCYPNERAYVPVIVINPNSLISITSCYTSVQAGDRIPLVVTVQNPGNVPLTNVHVSVSPIVGDLPASPTGGDTNGNGILDVGETWWWIIPNVQVNATTTFIVTSHETDPLQNDVLQSASFSVIVSGSQIIPGDANLDGSVNMADVTKVLRIILGLDPVTPGADANQDGQINMADVTKIQMIILGI